MKTAYKGPAEEEDPTEESGKVRGAGRPDESNTAGAKGGGSVKERAVSIIQGSPPALG